MRRLLALAVVLLGNATAQQPAANTVRVWAFDGVQPLLLRWEADFTREHPGTYFENTFHGAAAIPAGLYDGVADIAFLGREWWPVDNMAFHWVYQYAPFGIEVVGAGACAPWPSFSPVVIVNVKNPIASISMAQLDGVFGSLHKASSANLREWNALGVTGPLAYRTIVPVNFGADDPLGVYFRKRVLKEDYKPNPATLFVQGQQADTGIARRVARDPGAIGLTSGAAAAAVAGVKVIAVQSGADTANTPSDRSVADGTYPLSRTLSLYVNRKPGERVAAPVESFLLFVLSDQGQSDVHPGEGFIPLSVEKVVKARERVTGDWTREATSKEWKQ